MSWSVAAREVLAFANGIGPGAYLPVLAPGPLRDVLRDRVCRSTIGGAADTEANGGFNSVRTTTATLTEGGDAYLLVGEKVCIGNGQIADFLAITATVQEADGPRTRLFFVDTHVPGLEVRCAQEMLGRKGVPFVVLRFDNVRVPREHAVINPEGAWRNSPELGAVAMRGRLLIISAAALAIARNCLGWSRAFVTERRIDGRPLGEYDEIKRMLAKSAAEVFAMAVVEWCLLGDAGRSIDVRQEQVAAKNITSITCWRLVDRTMSLLGLEGYETAQSKGRRGAMQFPVERALRDARGLRVAGGVDFNLDNLTARGLLTSLDPAVVAGATSGAVEPENPEVPELSNRNRGHLRFVTATSGQLAQDCLRLSRRFPELERLFENEHALILVRRIANQLFAMSAVLARAASGGRRPAGHEQELADVYRSDARLRLAHWSVELALDSDSDHAAVADRLAVGGDLDYLLRDSITPGHSPLVG